MVATCLVGIIASIWGISNIPHKRIVSVSDLFDFLLLFHLWALAVGIFGWLLGIPFILLVRNSRGWRFWIYFALGSGIGPAIFLSPVLYPLVTDSSFGIPTTKSPDYSGIWISAAVSNLTTLIYLLLLRRPQLARKSS